MQAPSQNRITQGQHLASKAVDHGASPDPDFYAPEAGTILSYNVAGDCGNNLRMRGTSGLHSFCHLEKSYVKTGQKVARGQRLGKMGYTGYTIPKGPGGRHLHYWLQTPSGYVYPPTRYNQAFIKPGAAPKPAPSKGGKVMDSSDVRHLYRYGPLGRTADAGGLKNYTGKKLDVAIQEHYNSPEGKNRRAAQAKQVSSLKAAVASRDAEIKKLEARKGTANPADTQDAGKFRQILQILGLKK